MSNTENGLNEAILEWMERHGIALGQDCPVLKVSVVGFAPDGTPLIRLRPAYDHELVAAMGTLNAKEN